MTFPRYLFISYYQYSEFWWLTPVGNFSESMPNLECNEETLTNAIYRSLAVDYFPMPTAEEENSTTDVGYVSARTRAHTHTHNTTHTLLLIMEQLYSRGVGGNKIVRGYTSL